MHARLATVSAAVTVGIGTLLQSRQAHGDSTSDAMLDRENASTNGHTPGRDSFGLPKSGAPIREAKSVAPSDVPRRPSEAERPIVVGIAGGTGSGKTTVSRAIASRLGRDNLIHIAHDSYYKDLSHLAIEERAQVNFDHPDSLDSPLLLQHLAALKEGHPVQVPIYNYSTHSREADMQSVSPARIILVEGILLFAEPELAKACDIKIFVDTEADLRFIRRLRRDITERGRTAETVIAQYTETVRPMHNEFVEPSKRFADIIIPTGLNSVALEMVIARLESFLPPAAAASAAAAPPTTTPTPTTPCAVSS
ncbi:hypothetical protein EMIHUDRAFT_427275 [Emiliania huxleyi CCMP1516]|uniref:Uridine kinase n=2 Tax=Emiliania huxleyi TaxID=2903 RepID=A0A0D3JAP4_EMIH1|nr:hypothetical protein EMIHUDRAFT_427275 [Emiliania huxleyi CCMP1516]EOD20579.1 hypothetical protein EMIHUDRAFT_427275 [Emiliania huxleyi CCMP1516]|eukprot:XP_005773008.1 hypothetical protein EMIHUDRAFT_427275 [Emiliania huxleyi CCMP1516]